MGTKFEIKEICIDCILILNRKNYHSDEIRKLYAPFLADSDVDGGVAHDVNGFGTDLLLGTLPPPAAPPVALLLAGTFTGETGGVFLGILVVAPPDPTFLVGDSPTGCCVFSSTPLSWSPSVNRKFMKMTYMLSELYGYYCREANI